MSEVGRVYPGACPKHPTMPGGWPAPCAICAAYDSGVAAERAHVVTFIRAEVAAHTLAAGHEPTRAFCEDYGCGDVLQLADDLAAGAHVPAPAGEGADG